MSEEIVNRMKAEGQLIRNTGTNSIRAVRIQLDRFEGIFESISENISAQTQMMASMLEVSMDQLKINEETAEREEARRQRNELAEDQKPKPTPSTDITEDDLPNTKTREGLFSKLLGGGLGKLFFGGALAAGGAFFAYNFIKGFIDEKTGGGFSRFETGIVNFVKDFDFNSIKNSFQLVKENLLSVAENLEKIALFLENPFENFDAESIFNTLSFGMVASTIIKSKMPPQFKMGALAVAAGFFALRGSGGDGVDETSIGVGRAIESGDQDEQQREYDRIEARERELQELEKERELTDDEMNEMVRLGIQKDFLTQANPNLDRVNSEDDFFQAEMTNPKNDSTSTAQSYWPPLPIDLKNLPSIAAQESTEITPISDEQDSSEQIQFEVIRPQDRPDFLKHTTEELNDMIQVLNERVKRIEDTEGFESPNLNAPLSVLNKMNAELQRRMGLSDTAMTPNFSRTSSSAATNTERVEKASTSNINMPVIVNNSPMVAPIVNNVTGGPSVTNTNLFGAGGGDRSRNPYGIPSGVN